MSGMFESWMHKLVSALMQRETDANVVVVDWIAMAQQLYPDAVNHTHDVGLDIAGMLNWLQVCTAILVFCCGSNPDIKTMVFLNTECRAGSYSDK